MSEETRNFLSGLGLNQSQVDRMLLITQETGEPDPENNLPGDNTGGVEGLSLDAQARIASTMQASVDALENKRQAMIAEERRLTKSALVDAAFEQAIQQNFGQPLSLHQKIQILERFE
jgi:hypothetical protein